MNLLLKILFFLILILNNRFTHEYSVLLKPAYFGIAIIFFYYLIGKIDTLSINTKEVIPIIILGINVILLLVSGFYNSVNIEMIIYGIFPYIYILLMYLLIHSRKNKDNQSIIIFAEQLIFVNALICFLQGSYLLSTRGQWQDLVTGIHPYGTANELGYVFLMGILINNFLKPKFYKWKTSLYVVTIFLMEAKGSILALILALIIINFENLKKLKEGMAIALIILTIGSGTFYFINKHSHSIRFKTDIFKAFTYESSYRSTSSAARIAHLIHVAKNYFRMYNLSPLFGSGIGTYESPAGYFFDSPYLRMKKIIFWNKTDNTPQLTHTQIATLLAEGGYLGILCFELGLIMLLIILKKDRLRYSLGLLSAFFVAQIFHYIFLTFLTFMIFWPVLFIFLEKERKEVFERTLQNQTEL